ncbi:hypothetical protein [Dictyobacter kobayashii]|uniref:hypothetical protein n=1 Tax=Dictyobacter kobayashii TaxID=2014872 RepID=UPI00138719BF|nr:hypothetical protein [Dictyobacter kobayashii]
MPRGTPSLGYGAAGSAEGGNRPLRAEPIQFVFLLPGCSMDGMGLVLIQVV